MKRKRDIGILNCFLILTLIILIGKEAFASTEQMNTTIKSYESDYLGQTCQNNYHCNVSSWCCSEYKCVPGIICQNG